jgi:hypothetical protein
VIDDLLASVVIGVGQTFRQRGIGGRYSRNPGRSP